MLTLGSKFGTSWTRLTFSTWPMQSHFDNENAFNHGIRTGKFPVISYIAMKVVVFDDALFFKIGYLGISIDVSLMVHNRRILFAFSMVVTNCSNIKWFTSNDGISLLIKIFPNFRRDLSQASLFWANFGRTTLMRMRIETLIELILPIIAVDGENFCWTMDWDLWVFWIILFFFSCKKVLENVINIWFLPFHKGCSQGKEMGPISACNVVTVHSVVLHNSNSNSMTAVEQVSGTSCFFFVTNF